MPWRKGMRHGGSIKEYDHLGRPSAPEGDGPRRMLAQARACILLHHCAKVSSLSAVSRAEWAFGHSYEASSSAFGLEAVVQLTSSAAGG